MATFEFHELHVFLEQMLHTKTLSGAVSGMQRYYLSEMCASRLHCVNAFNGPDRLWSPMALQFSRSCRMRPDDHESSGRPPLD